MVADLAEVRIAIIRAALKCILKAMTFTNYISGYFRACIHTYKADNIVWTLLVGH